MLGPLGHLGAALTYALRRGARRRADHDAAAATTWTPDDDAALPRGLSLEWLGTSGFRIGFEGHQLLVDPYLTRIPLGDLVRRRAARPRWEAIAARVPAASAILIGHTHFDHAMDAPVIAGALGCPVYGGASLGHLMGLHGLADRAVLVEPHRSYPIGPFTVRFVPSRHSKLGLGLWTPYDGELSCEHLDELTPQAYRCGQVWGIRIEVAGAVLYHQGSCDLVDDEIPRGEVDVLLAGIAGRRFTPRYLDRLLARIEPRVIVAHHWDDFFRPLDAPIGFSLNVNLDGFVDEIARVSRSLVVRTLSPGSPVGAPP
jgi:L-ascorbate metabolism protein UlaG (beta-lactamase superfamily)